MILDLTGILRSRLKYQVDHGGANNKFSLENTLKRAIWIEGEFGLIARTGISTRSALNRLSDNYTFKIPINRTYRIIHKDVLNHLYIGHQQPGQDIELIALIPKGGISRGELAIKLEMSIRKLNYRLRKEQNNWQIIKQDDLIYQMKDKFDINPTIEELVLLILKSYPFCTISQIELISGLSRIELAGPITRLHKKQQVIRGLTRVEAPDEIFAIPEQRLVDEYEQLPVCVFEKRDAMVELIKLERYFETHNGDYWIFIDGLPQAEFDLDRQGKSNYTVKNLNRFITTHLSLPKILESIRDWGKTQKIEIIVDLVEDKMTSIFKSLSKLLLSRGYMISKNKLVLDRQEVLKLQNQSVQEDEKIISDSTSRPQILNWHLIGQWAKNRQLLDYSGTEAEIVHALGQVDDIGSIAYRLSRNPERLWFEDVVYIPGINFRLGFVHKNDVEDIVRGWPKQVKLNFIDEKILGILYKPKLTEEIIEEINDSPMTIKQRLRYLEKFRVIRKQLPGSLNINNCAWIKFDDGLPKYQKTVGGKRAMASVGKFLIRSLETNPPLTKSQLSRFLGLTENELGSLLKQYVRTGKILEGYFLGDLGEIQYTLAEVLDTVPREITELESSAVLRVDILPISDPYAIFHLPPLVLNDQSIQATRRYHEKADQWMITWDGIPVGYFIKEPTLQAMVDYELDLKITKKMVTTPIIAGTLQKIVTIFRTWYDDECKLNTINDIPAKDDKWREIKFLIDSIGIIID